LSPQSGQQARIRLTALIATGVVVGMVGMAYAAVPLYQIFCQVTGYGGTTQVAAEGPEEIGERVITVRFNADTARDMRWNFRPQQRAITLRVGEHALALYEASNPTDDVKTITLSYTFFEVVGSQDDTAKVIAVNKTAEQAAQKVTN
jgi:cytochrome c oxidase assembly protein subunit 11